MNGLKLRIS